MKKQFYLLLTSVLFLLSLITGCTNVFQNYSEEETGVEQKITISLSVNDFEQQKSTARTILPAAEDGSTVSKFVLEGLHSKDSSGAAIAGSYTELGSWTTYGSFNAAKLEVLPGTWSFKLKCYKTEDGQNKVFASAEVLNKELTFTDNGQTPYSLVFNLSYDDNALTKGKIQVKVNVPENQLTKAMVYIYTYKGGLKTTYILDKDTYTATETGDAAGFKAFTINEGKLPKGYYFLEMHFYTDATSTPTAKKVEYFKIAGGQTSKATLKYDKLNLRYTVTYHSMLPDGETVTMPADFTYNSSTNITLPNNSTVVADHYDFAGWYESSDYSGSAITSWAAGDRSDAVNLYAKWTPKNYTVNMYDYKGNQATGKTFSGTSILTLDYEEGIPDPVLSIAIGADDSVVFAGWYSDAACTSTNKVTHIGASVVKYNASSGNDEIFLYAKWIPKNIYVSSTGSNTANGYTSSSPLATIEEAKAYLSDKTSAVRILSKLTVANNTTNNPSGISNKALYGNGTSPVIVERYGVSCTDTLFSVSGTSVEFNDVTIDGGSAKTPALNADDSLVTINNSSTVTFNQNVILQNNNNGNATGKGGALNINGTFISLNKSNKILNNQAYDGGGIYCVASAKAQADGLTVEGNSAGNNGGGICSASTAATYTYFSNIQMKNNTAVTAGQDIFIDIGGAVQLDNCNLLSGSSYSLYNNGKVFLSGKSYIKGTYLSTDALIYPRDYYSKSAAVKVNETENILSLFNDYTSVTTLTLAASLPANTYNAADSSTYIKVLDEQESGSVLAHYKKFKSDTPGYTVNNLGLLIYDPLSTMNVKFDVDYEDYSTTDLVITVTSKTATSLTVTAPSGYSEYTWIFNGDKKSETSNTLTVDISASGAGVYEVVVVTKDSEGHMHSGTKYVEIAKAVNAGGV